MATKKKAKKAAKKAAKKVAAVKGSKDNPWTITVGKDERFPEDPLNTVNSGDFVQVFSPQKKIVIVTVDIQVKPGKGGGGPIIITS